MTEIVAEISGNHGGSLYNAVRLVWAAADAGADAVKFQCFEPERLALKRGKNPRTVKHAADFHQRSLLDLYREIHTPKDWFPDLIRQAEQRGLQWFSSVFDPADVAFLETLHCPRYKISAFEMLDGDLINAVVRTGKPIVISVRPTPGVTVLVASEYDGKFAPLGISSHNTGFTEENGPSFLPNNPDCPMVEYHLRLQDVDTPDKDFSVTEQQLREIVGWLK
jgi:sialic acid synthase SpsE